MATDKHKQNLRFKATSQRMSKLRYDGLSKDQISIVKTKQQFEQADKELNDFWKHAPRLNNNSVDWDQMNDNELDYFEHIYKKHGKLVNKLSRFEDEGFNIDETMRIFMMLNVKSASF